MEQKPAKYFVVKVANIAALRKCINTGMWACKDRKYPPHPRNLLEEAYHGGDSSVILVFSVSNCHGWHGYAEMLSLPCKEENQTLVDQTSRDMVREKETEATLFRHDSSALCDKLEVKGLDLLNQNIKEVNNLSCEKVPQGATDRLQTEKQAQKETTQSFVEKNINKQNINEEDSESKCNMISSCLDSPDQDWWYFKVKWLVEYLSLYGEQCLTFQSTADLVLTDSSPINKSRNWQEIDPNSGHSLCTKIDGFYEMLCEKRNMKLLQKEKRRGPDFFTGSEENVYIEENWVKIVEKVEKELGRVLMACPFGSQRYNLHTPSSDMDMFIVYQAHTSQVLGFQPPKHTVKNSEKEACDYTIHEVYRYCELLLSGDHRCVETLFLDPCTIYKTTPEFLTLCDYKHLFCNRSCLDKYMRDATGNKGTKQFTKWLKDLQAGDSKSSMSSKMNKLAYVIIRLLQNACDIVTKKTIEVYRKEGSEEYSVLMDIRSGGWTVKQTQEQIDRLVKIIEDKKNAVPHETEEMKNILEKWLIQLRYDNFQQNWDRK